EVVLALSGLESDAANRTRFTLRCGKPERAQRLHLLALSTAEEDEAALQKRMLEAFRAKPGADGQLRTPAVAPVCPYGGRTGDSADRAVVLGKLFEIKSGIRRRASAGQPVSDLVVFYYQGRDLVSPSGYFFLTAGGPPGGARAPRLSCDDVA